MDEIQAKHMKEEVDPKDKTLRLFLWIALISVAVMMLAWYVDTFGMFDIRVLIKHAFL